MADPLHQFEIQPILGDWEIAGFNISFTNSALWMLIATIVSTLFFTYAMRKKALVPGRMQSMAEMTYEFVAGMVRENIGPDGRQYFPMIFTIFVFILMGNLLGLIPYSFTYTSHIIVTFALAALIFLMVIILGVIKNGVAFFRLFLPADVPLILAPIILPLELVSFLSRPLTLSIRLFANMMAGHLMLKVFAGFSVAMLSLGHIGYFASIMPMLFNTVLMAFELLVALLQAYVFAILSCIYLKDTVDLHH